MRSCRLLSADENGTNFTGQTLYAYVGNNPLGYSDPLGLWQFTISVGDGFAGVLTFGYNSGQANYGAWIGVGGGLSASLRVTDSGCHEAGGFRGLRADGKAGIGAASANFSTFAGPTLQETELSTQALGVVAFGINVENGKVTNNVNATFVGGDSVFLGYGGQVYW